MPGLSPIPTSRVSDLLARTRLMSQLQADQLDLFRIQDQLSTGRRISLPSDDAPAALRAITLQRLIERKDQVRVNLTTNQSFLAATDNALMTVSGLLADIRGATLGVAGTTNTDEQRQAVAQQVNRAIQQLVDVGNQSFRGRYLFAGSRTGVQPYDYIGDFIEYSGNERALRSYSDLDVLFETNIHGGEVLGAISETVQGTSDLNPHVTADTLLSDLRGGLGISANGAIVVSDGTHTSIVDLSNASTVGDVAGLMEANPPSGRTVTVDLTSYGFSISLDAGGGGNLTVTEVAGGNTAHELGIFEETGVLTGPLNGSDLNPDIRPTTPLDNLLGTKARVAFNMPGANNDLLIEAAANGVAFDGVTVQFIPGGTAGIEVVTFAGGPKTLTIQIEVGASTAEQVAAAITAEGTYHAETDDRDALSDRQAGAGPVDVTATAVTSGGTGITLDRTGLQITNLGQTHTIDVTATVTVEDLLNEINGAGAGLLAEINATRDGINVRSRISGADFAIGENGGATAAQLGVRTLTETTQLADLNFDIGVPTVDGTDFTIVRNDGTELAIDVSLATTIGDVLNLINGHASNPTGPTAVVAQLAEFGNGIELFDASPVAPNVLTVRMENQSRAAEYLGLVDEGATDGRAATPGNDPEVLTGRDVHPLQTESIFNTLIRLKDALENGDILRIGAAVSQIDADILRVSFGRSEVGARQQGLDVLQTRLEDEEVELKSALSLEIDADLTETISKLTARQISLQASLQTTANLLQLTLLDFL